MNEIKLLFLPQIRVVSSVGLEHYLDRVGVTGSTQYNPQKKAQTVIKQLNALFSFVLIVIYYFNSWIFIFLNHTGYP